MSTDKRLERIQEVVNKRQKDIVLVLEDIYDPHNAEAIFRSCDAFGVQSVFLIFDKQEVFDPKKIGKSTSSSANKWLDFHLFDRPIESVTLKSNILLEPSPTEQCLLELKKQNYQIVGTVLDKAAKNLYEFVWPEKIALVVGNEHSGLSETAVKLCDRKVYIPMQGMVESLNVSVATAICLSEVFRSRLHKKNCLSESEKKLLIKSFSKR